MGRIQAIAPRIATLDIRSAKPPPKTADPFYLTPEWRGLVLDIKAKRGERCEACNRTGTRLFGDHIHEIKDGGALLDPSNVRLLCGACHTRKTIRARAARMSARIKG